MDVRRKFILYYRLYFSYFFVLSSNFSARLPYQREG